MLVMENELVDAYMEARIPGAGNLIMRLQNLL